MRLPSALSARTASSAAFFTLVAVLAACSAAPSDRRGGKDESDEILGQTSSAIINGSLDTTHPAVVALILSQGSQGGLCSGTIVKTDTTRHIGWVVTAAHCVELPPAIVVQAEDMTSPNAIRYEVIDYKADSRWSGQTDSAYDFAVVRIAGVDASTPVLPLTTASDGLSNGAAVKSVGFGRTTLISAMTPDKNTQRYFVDKTLNALNSSHMGYDMSDKGICQGDSGGPVIRGTGANEKVVGVHSYVQGDCNGEGVSGRVSLALDSFFTPELTKALPADSCGLCEKVANSGKNECAALSASCLSDPNCKGYYECLSEKPKADCIKQYPLAEGPFYAAANCICTRSCKTLCAGDDACSRVPKCGYPNERGDCATCLESSCCEEETNCAANGQCYVCLKNKDADPVCASNAARKTLAACATTKCATQCKGTSVQTVPGEEPPPADEDPGAADAGAPVVTTTTTTGCSFAGSSSAPSDLGVAAIACALAGLAGTRRRRRAS